MPSLKHIVLRNTLWGAVEAVVEFIVPTVIGILVARAMGPAKLGAWGYVLWVSLLALVIGHHGVSNAVRKFLAQFFGGREYGLGLAIIRAGLIYQWVGGILLTSLGLAWVQLKLPDEQHVYASIAIISILPAALVGVASAVNDVLERLHANVIPSVLGVLLQAALSGAALLFDWDLEGLAAAVLAGRIVDSALRWWFAKRMLSDFFDAKGVGLAERTAKVKLSREVVREIGTFCIQASVLLLLWMVVWGRSELFFLERYCSLEQIGFYSVAITFSELPLRLAYPFTRAAMASLYAERGRSAEGAQRFAGLFCRYSALIVIPVSVGLCVLSGPLIRVLYGAQYAAAAPLLFWAMFLGFLAPLAEPATNLLTAGNGQRTLVRWNVAAAIVILALDAVLVKHFCAFGAAVALGAGRTFTAVGVVVVASYRYEFRAPLRFIGQLLLATLGMAGAVLLAISWIPDEIALGVGTVTGVLVFIVMLRLLRVMTKEDAERFSAVQSLLPGSLRPKYEALLAWLVPRAEHA